MPVRHRDLGDELADPQPKRCKHCDESRSSCGGGGSEGSEGRASWRVTLDQDLVETLSAIYPEWFKPGRAASPASPRSPPSPQTPPSDDTFSSGAEEMAGRQAGSSSGSSEPPSSPRVSPPKVVVDDSPLQPAMGKHKESLKVKLMMRRPINQLVAQGIMPPLKTPPAYFGQCKQLVRAKTVDLLNAKLQQRPDRQELERRHILEQESHVDPSLAERQRMLKKARLADQLNDQLSHRPGPLELIKKNILHTEENIETAVKSGVLAFKATSEGASGRPQHPSSYCGPSDEVSPSPSPPSTLSPPSVASPPQHPAPGKDKNRKKSKQKQQPKARFKFHEYKGPPSAQKASTPPDSTDPETPYELLLQQQQLLLQLMVPASPASVASPASDTSDHHSQPAPTPALLPAHTHHHHQHHQHQHQPSSRLEDMKVSDLRAECKRLNLRVSGPKPQLIERLRAYRGDTARHDEPPPRSPASVTSVTSATSIASIASIASLASIASPEPKIEEPEDIVQSQRRQIEELERKLEASRQQLESVRREAAGAAASDQSRRLLQAYVCMSQLRAQLDALQQPQPAQHHYILNGVKVVPIAILPAPAAAPALDAARPLLALPSSPAVATTPAPAPAPPSPPPPPLDGTDDSQIMDDVLEILVENGELPAEAVAESTPLEQYLSPVQEGGDELQRELDDIQHEMLCAASEGRRDDHFHTFDPAAADHDDFFLRLLAADQDMDVEESPLPPLPPPPPPPLPVEHPPSQLDMEELSLPELSPDEHFDIKDIVCELGGGTMSVDDSYDYMEADIIPNHFGRGHVAPCDPLLGGALQRPALQRPAPRPARKHYSWERIEFDAT